MKVGIGVVFILLVIIYYYMDQKKKRRGTAINLQDQIRKIANNLRRSAENLDSRIQWEFQDDDDYAPIKQAFIYFKEQAQKTDWNLAGFYEEHKSEWDEIYEISEKWVKKKPNYDTKEEYLRDMQHICDIIQRW